MQNTPIANAPLADAGYEAPELTPIGAVATVVMGMPGGGFDGAYGMTEPDFEFEPDDLL
jgi:hypothetical protein